MHAAIYVLLILLGRRSRFTECVDQIVHVRWVPVTTAWWFLGLWMEERPPAMEVSCEYIE
jgi:hypothetical protein